MTIVSRLVILAIVLYGLAILFRTGLARIPGGSFFARHLLRLLDRGHYRVVSGVRLVPGRDETWVDHVVVSVYGVFIIDIREAAGWISGAAGDKTWSRRYLHRVEEFENPLLANQPNVRALCSRFGLGEKQVRPVIVFAGGAVFRDEVPVNVTGLAGFIGYIKSFMTEIIKFDRVEAIATGIESEEAS